MTCNLASLSGAMYHGFEGAISTFGVYFPYLNLALKWSNEPGPPHCTVTDQSSPGLVLEYAVGLAAVLPMKHDPFLATQV